MDELVDWWDLSVFIYQEEMECIQTNEYNISQPNLGYFPTIIRISGKSLIPPFLGVVVVSLGFPW
jgi:hypothetical protein